MNKWKIKNLIISSLVLSSCHFFKKSEINYEDTRVDSRAADFKIPKIIFDEAESEVSKETPNLQPVYLFFPIKVALFSRSKDVVKNQAVRITYPTGGGSLDLKNYISNQGSFSLSFPPEQFAALPTLVGLYFISDSPKKKIDGEEFGMGCAKFVNLKDQFKSLQKDDFLKLNTTDLRYLYVVSGIFVFVFRDRNQIYLSHLRITDSRYPEFFCSTLYNQ